MTWRKNRRHYYHYPAKTAGGLGFWENSLRASDSAEGAWRAWKVFLPNHGPVLPVLLRALRQFVETLVVIVAVDRDEMALA